MTQTVELSTGPRTTSRSGAVGALVVAGAVVVLAHVPFRSLEALLGAGLGGLASPSVGDVEISGPTFILWAGTHDARPYYVHAACTVVPFVAAALLVAATMLVAARELAPALVVRRALLVVVGLLAANTLRIAGIVVAVGLLGPDDGYWVGHRLVGTLLMLLAVGAGLWFLLRPLFRPAVRPVVREVR
ncbi:hypothetical protein [Nocardioides sp. TF02-7]|uniref:hypothetical protein n=1 Tax=Nocardioides sp. TF02-7 TaxID=2917724 RepID=UPI001F069D7B|nr:hypothetical protein [Nocardioides sp. TF02-7]UMG94450.1 hypothetical protein MF408_10960 [Nocardioides sp. TF02-7]